MLKGKTVVLGVTGSIAAYKIANLASMLSKLHADIQVLMTENATNFINPITFETLTGHKCLIDTFDRNFQYLSLIHIFWNTFLTFRFGKKALSVHFYDLFCVMYVQLRYFFLYRTAFPALCMHLVPCQKVD